MKGSTWPLDRLNDLIRMWAEGSTQRAISEQLSTRYGKITVNMVAGQISRLGISRSNMSVLARQQAERDRIERLDREAMEREHEKIVAAHLRRSGDAKICSTVGCHGPRQPGHRLGYCAVCDQAEIKDRVTA